MEVGDYFGEIDFFFLEYMDELLSRNNFNMRREGVNGNVDGRFSVVSIDDEFLDIRIGALEYWYDFDEEEVVKNFSFSKFLSMFLCL